MTIPDIYCKKTIRHTWHWEWWENGYGIGTKQEWDYSTEVTDEFKWLNGAMSQSSSSTGSRPPDGMFSELCCSADLVNPVENSPNRVEWTEYGSDPPEAVPWGSILYTGVVELDNGHSWADFTAAREALYASLDGVAMVSEFRSHSQPCIHVYHNESGAIVRHSAAGWTEDPPGTSSFTAHADGFYYCEPYSVDEVPNKVSKMFWVQQRYAISGLNGLMAGRYRGTKIAIPISTTDDPDVEVIPGNVYVPPGWIPANWPPPATPYNDPPDVLWWNWVPTYWDVVSGATLYVSECNWSSCLDALMGIADSTIEVPDDEYLALEADTNSVAMVVENTHHVDCGYFQSF
jgi:hypothetical protein